MVNEKVITNKKMIEHINPTMVRYYEDTFLKNALPNERDSKSYQELNNFIDQSRGRFG